MIPEPCATTPLPRATGRESQREVIDIVRDSIIRVLELRMSTGVPLRTDGRPDLRVARAQIYSELRDIFDGVPGAPSMRDLSLILDTMAEQIMLVGGGTGWPLADAFGEGP